MHSDDAVKISETAVKAAQEAIDAATKPLHVEIERLKGEIKTLVEDGNRCAADCLKYQNRVAELEQQSVRDGHINSALDNAANVMAEKLYGEPKPFVVPEWAQAKPATSPHRLRANHSVKVEVILTPYSANMTFKVDPCTIRIMDRIIFGFLFEPVPDPAAKSVNAALGLAAQFCDYCFVNQIVVSHTDVQRFERWLRTNGYLRKPDVQATGYQTIDELVDEWGKANPNWMPISKPGATAFGNWLRTNGYIKDPSDRGSINERAMIIRSAHAYADSMPDGEGRNAVRRFADSLNSGGMS